MNSKLNPISVNSRLNCKDRQAIGELLLKESKAGRLRYGSVKQAAELFHTSESTVKLIWRQTRLSLDNGTTLNLSLRLVGTVGRKRIQIDINRIKEIPLCRRTNIRFLACAVDVSTSTLFRCIKEGAIRAHTNAIKPHLTENNKKVKVRFCLSMLDPDTLHSNPKFSDMFNSVHIDENGFFYPKNVNGTISSQKN